MAVAAAMPVVLGVSQAQAYDYMAVGIGTMPCKYWLSTPQLEGEGNTWILGWWTGLDSRNDNHWVGSSTDGNGIILVVKKECQHNPNKLLMNVMADLFKKWNHPPK